MSKSNLLLFLVGLFFSFTQQNNSKNLTVEEVQQDINSLRRALDKYHPGMYWYTSKEEFNLIWENLNGQIQEPLSGEQFFRLVLPVVAKVQCAHTLFYPSPVILSSGSRFPLDLKFIKGKAFIVSDSLYSYGIPIGSQLLAINGNSFEEILDQLLPNLQAQGGNMGWKYVILENDFQNYYYYLIEKTDSFEIEYSHFKTGQRYSVNIPGSFNNNLRKHWRHWYPETEGAPLSFRIIQDKGAALITIKSFVSGRYKQFGQDFDELIDQYFKEILLKRINNLIIDLRGNEGGNNPEKLYSYLIDKEAEVFGIKPSKNNFEGNVIVLTNERSISAQETFVSIFNYFNRGLTIGMATPGCTKYLCGGKKHKLVLPNSQFEINIPTHESFRMNQAEMPYNQGEGYLPDFMVEEKIEDFVKGRDVVLEFALNKLN